MTWTITTADHVFVYVRGMLVMKTYRDGTAVLFQVAPSQAIRLP